MNNLLVQNVLNLAPNINSTKADFSRKEVSDSFKDVFSSVTNNSNLKGNKFEDAKSSKFTDRAVYNARNNRNEDSQKINESNKTETKKINNDSSKDSNRDNHKLGKTDETKSDEEIEKTVEKLKKVLNVDDKKLLDFINNLINQNPNIDMKELAQNLVNNFSQNTNELDKLQAINKVQNIVEDLVKNLEKSINTSPVSSDNQSVDNKSLLEMLQNKLEDNIQKKDNTPKQEKVVAAGDKKQDVQQLENPQDTNDKKDLIPDKVDPKAAVRQAINEKITQVTNNVKAAESKKDITIDNIVNLDSVKELTNNNNLVKDLPKDSVNKADIIKQVVDNAKLLITSNKKEMTINLSPANLGKLTLKVVSENGSLSAKILTENNTVKQAIESNMDNLRDALKSQGLEISQFSVSVGQDQRQNQNQNAQEMMNKISKSLKIKNIMNSLNINSYSDDKVQSKTYHPDSTVSYIA